MRESEARDRFRRLQVTEIMKKIAGESQERGDHGTMGSKDWACTFPKAEALYAIPTIARLLDDNELDISEEVIRANEDDVMAEVNVYQMKARRFIITQINKAVAVPTILTPPDGAVQIEDVAVEAAAEDLTVLRAQDERNIEILSGPTLIFPLSSYCQDILVTYPSMLPPNGIIAPHPQACSMAKAIIKASPSIAALEQTMFAFEKNGGQTFFCLCCPKLLRLNYTWIGLVRSIRSVLILLLTNSKFSLGATLPRREGDV